MYFYLSMEYFDIALLILLVKSTSSTTDVTLKHNINNIFALIICEILLSNTCIKRSECPQFVSCLMLHVRSVIQCF